MDAPSSNSPNFGSQPVRHVDPSNRISEVFTRLGVVAGLGLLRPDRPMIAIHHDDPETTPPADLRSDAAITVGEGVALPGELPDLRIPGGR